MEEIFKDIKGYEGIYKISSQRRIISCERIGENGKLYREKEMKFSKHSIYDVVCLTKDKVQKIFYVDRLMYEYFGKI